MKDWFHTDLGINLAMPYNGSYSYFVISMTSINSTALLWQLCTLLMAGKSTLLSTRILSSRKVTFNKGHISVSSCVSHLSFHFSTYSIGTNMTKG